MKLPSTRQGIWTLSVGRGEPLMGFKQGSATGSRDKAAEEREVGTAGVRKPGQEVM